MSAATMTPPIDADDLDDLPSLLAELPGAPDDTNHEFLGAYLIEPDWHTDPDSLQPDRGEAVCPVHGIVYWAATGSAAFCCT